MTPQEIQAAETSDLHYRLEILQARVQMLKSRNQHNDIPGCLQEIAWIEAELRNR
jgi:hypothetical protein